MKTSTYTGVILIALSLCFGCKKTVTQSQGDILRASVEKGLWAYYPFSDGSLDDKSGNNHSLKGSSNIKLGFDMHGNENEALEFNGTNDYAQIDASDFPDGDFSISFLVMPKKTSGNIIERANYTTGSGFSYLVGFNDYKGNATLMFTTNKTDDPCSSAFTFTTSTTLNDDKVLIPDAWYNVTVVYQDGTEKMYVNSTHVSTITTPSKALKNCKASPFYLGVATAADPHPFAGKIDNLRIYTRALSAAEVDQLYWGYK